MSTTSVTHDDAPIMGTQGNDIIVVERSISFEWVPDAGNSYNNDVSGESAGIPYSYSTTGPSTASGYVTFDGATSSAPFIGFPTDGDFSFTSGGGISLWQDVSPLSYGWTYDPAIGSIDPEMQFDGGKHGSGEYFRNDTVYRVTADWESQVETEHGHWQLVPDIHNLNIFGGAGNDTILGGQGKEMLFGGTGNDLIRASVGDDLLNGGTGDDELHGGIGRQTLMGGAGEDTIWGGTGAQLLMGGDGQDVLHAGSGPQTLMGGAGNDTLWGDSGPQLLQGGDGNDVIHTGSGNNTLSGGAGRDTFVFSIASAQNIIADFQPGQDMIAITSGFNGLTLKDAKDLLPHMSANGQGDAVLTVGNDFSLVLRHITLVQVEIHPTEFFKVS